MPLCLNSANPLNNARPGQKFGKKYRRGRAKRSEPGEGARLGFKSIA
jgi:hypothetical protein